MMDLGGYEYDFIDVPLDDQVICKICHNPCRDVHLTGCCGEHFCLTCLQQLKKGTSVNKACPMCREEKVKIFPNKRLDRKIKALKVYCINRKSGCAWSGEINNIKKHIKDDCLFVDIFCPSKCGLKLKRQCVSFHLSKECPCHCQYCGATGHKVEISKRHKKHCTQYPLPCPNGCDSGVVPSVGMDAHRQICPLELVRCEYFRVGCDVKVTRRELKDHYQQNVTEHLNLTTIRLSNVTEEMSRTEKKLALTAKELESTKSKYNKLEGRITNVDKEVDKIKSNQHQCAGETAVPQPVIDCAKHKFFECTFGRLLIIIVCILSLYIAHVNMTNERLSQTEQYTWPKTLKKLSTSDSNQVAPVTFEVPDYSYNDGTWYSPIFFVTEKNCETLLIITDYGSIVSLLFMKDGPDEACLMSRGRIKDTMFTIELLNQRYNSDHYMAPFVVDNDTCNMNEVRILCTIDFVSDSFLERKSDMYLRNGNAYMRITHDGSFYNHLCWYIWKIIGPGKSASEYYAYIFWLTIVFELLLELKDIYFYNAHGCDTRHPLFDAIRFVILFLYMICCVYLVLRHLVS